MYQFASIALFVYAIICGATSVIGNFSTGVLVFLPLGLVFLVTALGLFQRKRWAAWLGFLLVLPSISVALSGFNTYRIPNVFFYSMTVLNLLALMALFTILWQPGTAAQPHNRTSQ